MINNSNIFSLVLLVEVYKRSKLLVNISIYNFSLSVYLRVVGSRNEAKRRAADGRTKYKERS